MYLGEISVFCLTTKTLANNAFEFSTNISIKELIKVYLITFNFRISVNT